MAAFIITRDKDEESFEKTLSSVANVILFIILLIFGAIVVVAIVGGAISGLLAIARKQGWSWAGFKRCFGGGRKEEDGGPRPDDIELQSGIARPADVAVRGGMVAERLRVGRVMTPESSDDETLVGRVQRPQSIV